jgi:hypothetical protein
MPTLVRPASDPDHLRGSSKQTHTIISIVLVTGKLMDVAPTDGRASSASCSRIDLAFRPDISSESIA